MKNRKKLYEWRKLKKTLNKYVLTREIIKSVIKSVENEWIRNNWESTPYNVLGLQVTHMYF